MTSDPDVTVLQVSVIVSTGEQIREHIESDRRNRRFESQRCAEFERRVSASRTARPRDDERHHACVRRA